MSRLIEMEVISGIVAAVRKKHYPETGAAGSRYSEAVQALDLIGYALRDFAPPDPPPGEGLTVRDLIEGLADSGVLDRRLHLDGLPVRSFTVLHDELGVNLELSTRVGE